MAEMVIRAGLVQICFEEGSVCNFGVGAAVDQNWWKK